MILRVDAPGGFDVVFDIQGIEDLSAVFGDVELTVGRFAVFIRGEDIAGRQDLFFLFSSERASTKFVQYGFRRGL